MALLKMLLLMHTTIALPFDPPLPFSPVRGPAAVDSVNFVPTVVLPAVGEIAADCIPNYAMVPRMAFQHINFLRQISYWIDWLCPLLFHAIDPAPSPAMAPLTTLTLLARTRGKTMLARTWGKTIPSRQTTDAALRTCRLYRRSESTLSIAEEKIGGCLGMAKAVLQNAPTRIFTFDPAGNGLDIFVYGLPAYNPMIVRLFSIVTDKDGDLVFGRWLRDI